jgi:hypothetical protein
MSDGRGMWHVWGEHKCIRGLGGGTYEGKRTHGRPRRRWENTIEVDLKEIRYMGLEWINLAQDKDTWQAVVIKVLKLRFFINCWEFLDFAEKLLDSEEKLCVVELVS